MSEDTVMDRMRAWVTKMDDGFLYPSARDLWLTTVQEYQLRDAMNDGLKEIERLRTALEAHDGWLANTGHGADHPWRLHIARALQSSAGGKA